MTPQPTRRHVPVCVVLPPRTLLLDVAGPLEALRRANVVQNRVRFDVRYIAPRRSVTSSIGLEIANLEPLPSALPGDVMLVLMGNIKTAPLGYDGSARLNGVSSHKPTHHAEAAQRGRQPASHQAPYDVQADRADEEAIVEWLRGVVKPEHVLVSICSGALFAAQAGLLDGYACTTHYIDCGQLAAIAPTARVLENRLYVEDRNRLTSAGIAAGIDLMLHIISRFVDHACALAIARYLVVYLRRGGSDPQLSPWLEGRNHLHPAIHRVQDAVTADPAHPWTLESLADVAGASSRHLSRLFNEHVGMSVTNYRNRLRIAIARELLGSTHLDMEGIAERAGFASTRQLRRAWRQFYPTPPKEARRIQ